MKLKMKLRLRLGVYLNRAGLLTCINTKAAEPDRYGRCYSDDNGWTYDDLGRFQSTGAEHMKDLIAYIGPLPKLDQARRDGNTEAYRLIKLVLPTKIVEECDFPTFDVPNGPTTYLEDTETPFGLAIERQEPRLWAVTKPELKETPEEEFMRRLLPFIKTGQCELPLRALWMFVGSNGYLFLSSTKPEPQGLAFEVSGSGLRNQVDTNLLGMFPFLETGVLIDLTKFRALLEADKETSK